MPKGVPSTANDPIRALAEPARRLGVGFWLATLLELDAEGYLPVEQGVMAFAIDSETGRLLY